MRVMARWHVAAVALLAAASTTTSARMLQVDETTNAPTSVPPIADNGETFMPLTEQPPASSIPMTTTPVPSVATDVSIPPTTAPSDEPTTEPPATPSAEPTPTPATTVEPGPTPASTVTLEPSVPPSTFVPTPAPSETAAPSTTPSPEGTPAPSSPIVTPLPTSSETTAPTSTPSPDVTPAPSDPTTAPVPTPAETTPAPTPIGTSDAPSSSPTLLPTEGPTSSPPSTPQPSEPPSPTPSPSDPSTSAPSVAPAPSTAPPVDVPVTPATPTLTPTLAPTVIPTATTVSNAPSASLPAASVVPSPSTSSPSTSSPTQAPVTPAATSMTASPVSREPSSTSAPSPAASVSSVGSSTSTNSNTSTMSPAPTSPSSTPPVPPSPSSTPPVPPSPAPTPTLRSTESPSESPRASTASSLAGETPAVSRPPPSAQTQSSRASSSALRDVAHYSGVTAAGLSVALLLLFHQFAFDPRVAMAWPSMWTGVNAWELVLYAAFLQHLTALSQLELPQMPSSLHDFTDAFSWSNFLIQKTQIASDRSVDRSTQRRLAETSAASDGMNAYARRIGISPSSMLINGIVGVVLVFAVLLLVFAVVLVVSRKKTRLEKIQDGETTLRLPRRALRVVGVMLLLWLVALYPLTLLASFELGRQRDVSDHDATRLALAILVLALVVLLPLVCVTTFIYRQRSDDLQHPRVLAVWGALYAESPYRYRWFFAVPALAHVALGVVLSGAILSSARSSLGAAMGITVALLIAAIAISPYLSGVALLCVVAVGVVQLLNFGLAFAFLRSSAVSASSRQEIADVLLVVNVVVLVLWLVRHIVTLVIGIKMYARRDELPPSDPSTVMTPGADLAASGLVRHSAKHDASCHDGSSATTTMYMAMQPSPRDVRGAVIEEEAATPIGSSNVRVLGPRISL